MCLNDVLGPQSPEWDSSTPKPFRQDSQLSTGETAFSSPSTLQRHGSFSPGISPRPLSPTQSSSTLFRSGSDEGLKSDSAKPSGLFEMGSLTTDISDRSFKSSATRKVPSNQISSLRYRTSIMDSDDEDQDDIVQEGGSSMSEEDNSHRKRLAVSDIYTDTVLHSAEVYGMTMLIDFFIMYCLAPKV